MDYHIPMSAFFWVGILIILLTNIDTTRKILPIKDNYIKIANLVAAGLLLFWGVRSGALSSGM